MTPAEEPNRPPNEEPLPPVPEPRGQHREAWVGAFVIIGILATLAILFAFTKPSILRGRYEVTAIVDQAGGIRRGDPVQLRGVNVGRVTDFRIEKDRVAVKLEIESRYQIPRDSTVDIRSSGILGGMVVDIEPGDATERLRPGAVLQGTTEKGLAAAGDIAGKADDVLGRVQALLSPRTIQGIEGSSTELEQTLSELSAAVAEQRTQLAALTKSLRRSATNLEHVTSSDELQATVKRLDAVLAELEQTSQATDTVMSRIARGEGTLGRLTKEDALYVNANQAMLSVNETSAEVRRLVQDIRLHPKRYINVSVF